MRIQIIAEIEGLFILDKPVNAKLYPYDFSIYEERSKRYISISKPITNYQEVAPRLDINNGVPTIVATKHEAYKDMEQWLVYIEAMGAFNFEIERIHIDELEVKWICETVEEQGAIPIVSLKRHREDKRASKHLCDSNLSNLVIFRKALPEAYIPFSYYRQAKNFFYKNDYYFAFINYFMMLEFMFADGQFQQAKVIPKFKEAKLLELCILSALNMLKTNDENGINYSCLHEECQKRQKVLNFEGVIYVLVQFRGLLSHASEKSKSYLLDVEKLRPMTFFISLVCFLLCGYIQVYCCSSEESKCRMINERISELRKLCHD